MKKRLHIFIAILLCAICSGHAIGATDSISCVNHEADTITFNGADWSPIFNRMVSLLDTTSKQHDIISIVHLGDSHVQAGFFSEALRLPLQNLWGNAGRGLIAPLRICKTNEPADYRITSPDSWQHHRCIIGKKFSNEVGVSGIAITPVTDQIDLTFETMSRYGEEIGFNTLRLFHTPSDKFPQLLPADTPEGLNTFSIRPGETYFTWNDTIHHMHLQGANSYENQHAIIFGASLENGQKGIILHAIGNNSATYECYNRVSNYGEKLAMLEPQLVIISMGTNESVSALTTEALLYEQIDALVTSIRNKSPEALILLTTPADNKLRKRRKRKTYYTENKKITTVVETIKNYGRENNIAVWDWFTIGGGKGSCETWVKEKGMKKDHIHYTQEGYAIQGNLLYQSILKAYEQHIR